MTAQSPDSKREMLRHTVATLAYRGGKTLRGAPDGFGGLECLEGWLASERPLAVSPEELFQGPIADALTHVGQIALLRRIAEAPVRGESYYLAEIRAGRIGREQAAPRREFD